MVGNIDKALTDVVRKSTTAFRSSEQIANTTTEQARGTRKISESAEKMAHLSRAISNTLVEQSRGAEEIRRTVESMRDLADGVRKATEEQSMGTKQLAAAGGKAADMAQDIMSATREEAKGSERILLSIRKVKEVTTRNESAVHKLTDMIGMLNQQADLLGAELEKFTIDRTREFSMKGIAGRSAGQVTGALG